MAYKMFKGLFTRKKHKQQKATSKNKLEVAVHHEAGISQPQKGVSTTPRAASPSQSFRPLSTEDRLVQLPGPHRGRYEPLPAGEHAKPAPATHISRVAESQTAQQFSDDIVSDPSGSQVVSQGCLQDIPPDNGSRSGGLRVEVDHSRIINHGAGEVHVGSHNVVTTNILNESQKENHEEILRRIERRLGRYLVHNAALSNFHQPCYSGTRNELRHRLALWIAGQDYSFSAAEDPSGRKSSAEDSEAEADDFFEEYSSFRSPLDSSVTTTHFAEVFKRLQNCVCIVGDPGSGKSTIATSVVAELLDKIHEHCPTLVSADYCIRRTDESTTDPDKVLPTLIHGLAATNLQMAQAIDSALTLQVSKAIRVHKNQAAILLKAVSQHQGIVLLVIDALDELSRSASLATTLSTLIPQLPANVRLILSSRNERDVFDNIEADLALSIRLEIRTDESFQEVRNYIEAILRQGLQAQFRGDPYWDTWPTTTQLDRMAELADGLYVWAATASKLLLSSIRISGTAKRDTILERAAQAGGLDGLYTRILDDALGDEGAVGSDRLSYVNMILGFIVVSKYPLMLSEISALLDINPENFDIIRFAELAQTVLVAGMGHIKSSAKPRPHRTFIDFLTSPGAGEYQVFPSQAHSDVLCHTLRHLVTHLHFNMFGLESSFLHNHQVEDFPKRVAALPPGLMYSGHCWGYHLENCETESPLPAEFLRQLLADCFLFWLELISVALPERKSCGGFLSESHFEDPKSAMETLASRLQLRDEASWLVEAAQDAAKLLRVFLRGTTGSVPHIYISLLALCPMESLLARHFRAKLPSTVIPPVTSLHEWWWNDDDSKFPMAIAVTISVSRCGKWIARALNYEYEYCDDRMGSLSVWDFDTGEVIPGLWQESTAKIRSTAFSPDGRRIATFVNSEDPDQGPILRLWDLITGRCLSKLHCGDYLFRNGYQGHILAFSSDGTHMVSADSPTIERLPVEPAIYLWAVNDGGRVSGPVLTICPEPPTKGLRALLRTVKYYQDAPKVIFASFASRSGDILFGTQGPRNVVVVKVWENRTNKQSHIQCLPPDVPHSRSSYGLLELVCVHSWVVYGRLTQYLVYHSASLGVYVYDQHRVSDLEFQISPHEEVGAYILDPHGRVFLSPNNKYMAVRETDPKLWDEPPRFSIRDSQTGSRMTGRIGGHVSPICDLGFARDGVLFSADEDGTVRLWNIDRLLGGARPSKSEDSSDHAQLQSLTDEHVIDTNGWTLGPNGEHLFWAPEPIRHMIARPSTIRILGCPKMIEVDISNLVTGREWLECKFSTDAK